MRARRIAAPLAGVVVAVALFPATRALSEVAREGQLGPAFWPRLALLGLALACVARAIEAWRLPVAGDEAREPISAGRLAGGIALIVALAALTPVLGFPLATAAFIAAFMTLAGARSPLALAAAAALGTVGLVYVFVRAVYLPLPKGEGAFEAVTLELYRTLGVF